jgi:hypothetical protein
VSSVFAWVDFAEEDRRKMADVISLFREQDTRDELGIGTIRDALADLMFPGTSTIQTRARYFLFVPWIYQRLESKGIARAEIAKRACADEVSLIYALLAGEDRDGIIGIEKKAELQRLASNIYWAGLGVWRIRRFNGSQDQYHRVWDWVLRQGHATLFDDDGEPLDDIAHSWDPELPRPPSDFLRETDSHSTKPKLPIFKIGSWDLVKPCLAIWSVPKITSAIRISFGFTLNFHPFLSHFRSK